MDVDFDLESLVHVEQSFYDAGYEDGYAHGRIHGLIEGRALGREKGYEIWEELGFYEGFARTWRAILTKQSREQDRAFQHIRHILDGISQFPRVNPSASDPSSELDLPKLLRQIRSRYRVLCASLGVRPRLYSAESTDLDDKSTVDTEMEDAADSAVGSQRVAPGSAIPVWKLDNTGVKKHMPSGYLPFLAAASIMPEAATTFAAHPPRTFVSMFAAAVGLHIADRN